LRADTTSPDASSASSSQRRLLREARAMAKLAHPSVTAVYDVGMHADEIFLAMELVDGCSLTEWLRERRRSWREVLDVFRQAGEGLVAAHAAGIVHRDFKPDNVLVSRDGRVRVTDFGLARAAAPERADGTEAHGKGETGAAEGTGSSGTVTRTGAIQGTPAYMAPEQLDGGPADARSDLFSFCVSLYEGLYGARPFAGVELDVIRRAIEGGAFRTPLRGSSVPVWLRRIVLRGLRASPAARPESMRVLLDSFGAGLSRARRQKVLAASGALLLSVSIAAVATLGRARQGSGMPVASPPAAPSEGPTAITDLPLPASTSAEALQVYRRGIRKVRDGERASAADFARAAELDPNLAAAQLRYALAVFWESPEEGRTHLARAVEARDVLGDRDRLVLRAAEAWMRAQPADGKAFAHLLDEAFARYPLDAELALRAGFGRDEIGDQDGAIQMFDRATAIDPAFGSAYGFKAQALAYAGDVAAARATAEECLRRVPEATICLGDLTVYDAEDGRCDDLLVDGQRILAHEPSSTEGYWQLALAAFAQGRPPEVVGELLRQRTARFPEPQRAEAGLFDEWTLAVLGGDFDEARARADELERGVTADADQQLHARAALWWVQASAESGRPADAAARARDFLRRKAAWVEEPRGEDFAILHDPTPRLLLAERRGGLLSGAAFETERRRWVDAWMARVIPLYAPYVWLHGYAAVADTSDDATRALAELPRFGRMPAFGPLTLGDAYEGATYYLAGRAADAVPLLRRAARSCLAIQSPFEQTQATALLGEALAATGDRDGACGAYGVVLARWGRAKPRSLTAERVASLAHALGCEAAR
jgi:eukaryotic-like serine/threonine-protein kinase